MDKNYYKQLSNAYFEASLSPKEERRLKAWLAKTDDPDFDEIKVVAGYFSAGRALHGKPVAGKPASILRFAIAASLAAVVAIPLITMGIRERNRAEDLLSMENTLTGFFSSGQNAENMLAGFFDEKR
jgi:hypothetical protein